MNFIEKYVMVGFFVGGDKMIREFKSPAHYIQGKDVLTKRVGEIKNYGTNVLLLADDDVWEIVGEKICRSNERRRS